MTTSEDLRAGVEAEAQPPPPDAAAPQRHLDWISYAAAVGQPTDSPNDVETQHFASCR